VFKNSKCFTSESTRQVHTVLQNALTSVAARTAQVLTLYDTRQMECFALIFCTAGAARKEYDLYILAQMLQVHLRCVR